MNWIRGRGIGPAVGGFGKNLYTILFRSAGLNIKFKRFLLVQKRQTLHRECPNFVLFLIVEFMQEPEEQRSRRGQDDDECEYNP